MPSPHRDVRDVGGPYLIGPVDIESAQQIREDLMVLPGNRSVRLRRNGFETHLAHQPLHSLSVTPDPFAPKRAHHPARPEKRSFGKQFVDPTTQLRVIANSRRGLVVMGGPATSSSSHCRTIETGNSSSPSSTASLDQRHESGPRG